MGLYADLAGATPPVEETLEVRLALGSTLEVVRVPEAIERAISPTARPWPPSPSRERSGETCSLIVYDMESGRGAPSRK